MRDRDTSRATRRRTPCYTQEATRGGQGAPRAVAARHADKR